MERIKKEKGITLVALVITIIILLILAGVSLSAIVGENGIISRTQGAGKIYKISQYQEAIDMEIAALAFKDYTTDHDFFVDLVDLLSQNEMFDGAEYTEKRDGRLIITTVDGEVFEVVAETRGSSYVGTEEDLTSDLPKIEDKEIVQANIEFEYSPTEWTKDVVKVLVSSEEYANLEFEYSFDLSTWNPYYDEILVEKNGSVYVRVANAIGSSEAYATGSVTNIDKKAPDVTEMSIVNDSITTKEFAVSLSTQDTETEGVDPDFKDLSGLKEVIWYYKDSRVENYNEAGRTTIHTEADTKTGPTDRKDLSFEFKDIPTGSGTYNVYAEVYDVAGNMKATTPIEVILTHVDVGTHDFDPTYWTNGEVTVTLPTVEGYTTKYYFDEEGLESAKDYSTPFKVSANCSILYYVTDGLNILGTGAVGTDSVSNIDTNGPEVKVDLSNTGTPTTTAIKTTITVEDTESGFSHIDWYYKRAGDTAATYEKVSMSSSDPNYAAMNTTKAGSREVLTIEKEFTGLIQGENYNFYAKIYDVAGNVVTSPANGETNPLVIKTDQIMVSGIKVTPTAYTMNKGDKTTLSATVEPEGAKIKTISWASDTPTVATVDTTGQVTAVAFGTAKITATATDGSNQSGSSTITVNRRTYTVSKTGDNVTFGNASNSATEELSYETTITPSANYEITKIEVTMAGKAVTAGITNNTTSGSVNIPSVTGDIIITVTAVRPTYTVTKTTTNVSYTNNDASVSKGASYSTTINANAGYGISTVTVTHNGTAVTPTIAADKKSATVSISSATGNISISVTTSSLPSLISKVSENRGSYYGKKVIGYSANGIDDWKIFYDNGTNVFLITGLISYSKIPADVGMVQGSNERTATWATDPSYDSTGRQDTLFMATGYTMNSSNSNSKRVSKLLNTEIWKTFKDTTGYANYAIGSPTIEMWIESWNRKNPSEKLQYSPTASSKSSSGYGYRIGVSGGSLGIGGNWIAQISSDAMFAGRILAVKSCK